MRKLIIAGNWKMNTTVEEGLALVHALAAQIGLISTVDRVLCPPFLHLPAISKELRTTHILLGAQNAHWEQQGAFTGEISPRMLLAYAQYVIIGHSERRQYFGETDETVNRRLQGVLAGGLKPIMCVGETGAQRSAGETHAVIERQLTGGLEGLTPGSEFVVAYEPVWAIGTGLAATPADAQDACAFVRAWLRSRFDQVAEEIRVQYGGSVNAKNAAEILSQPDVDGALVGGASLDAEAFTAIVRAAAQVAAAQ